MYFVLILSSNTRLGAIFPLATSKQDINQFPLETQARIERVISESSLKVADIRLESTANIKVMMPEYPKRGIVPSNLFGQRQKLKKSSTLVPRGGDKSDKLNELSKLSFRVVNTPAMMRCIRQSPQLQKQLINFLVCKNQLVLNQVLPNLVNSIFNSPNFEIFNDLTGPAFNLILDQIPRSVRHLKGAFYNALPGADAFQQPIIQHRKVEVSPHQHNSALYSKSKKTIIELEAMLNKPAELGKMEVQSPLANDNSLRKEALKTFKDPANKRHAKNLIERCRAGDTSPGSGSQPIYGSGMFELWLDYGTRVAIRKINGTIEVGAIFDKHNQRKVLDLVRKRFPEN